MASYQHRKGSGPNRGQVIPYADQRAYTDRLNALFSSAGWTRRYTVHTSANFQRAKDQKTTAKVFVICDLTIFGFGSHSSHRRKTSTEKISAGLIILFLYALSIVAIVISTFARRTIPQLAFPGLHQEHP